MRENHKTGQGGLSVFCDKVIEAGWMAIVVVVPLFFHVYSYRSFEPDKITLMRSVALVMGLAWVIKELEVGYFDWTQYKSWRLEVGNWKSVLRLPLVLPTLFLAIVYIITTITSIAPQLSLWGSYHRMQGTYTTLSYIAIFFLILHALRNRRQLHRLITVMLFTSLPISLYGIIQHYGLDPIAWTNIGYEVTARAISTMGNPIFVAAYLIMIVPLTTGRLMQLYSSIRSGKRTASLYILSGCYAFLLVVQLLCILFTQSRGPLMGLMGGTFFFFLLLAASKGKKGVALAIFGVAIILGLFLIALNLSDTTFESIRGMPYLGPLSSVLDFESPTSWQRILAWEGATNLVTADPRRATIGYGPETMIMALNPYLPPDLVILKPNETFDRSHNETLDILATTGFMGFATYLLLFGSLFYYGLNYLGLVKSSKHRSLFILLCLVGGSAGGLLPWLWEGKWRLAGVGIPAGMLLALAIYLMTTFKIQSPKLKVQSPTLRLGSGQASNFQLLLIALLSAIIAHFIEIQFGIAIVATRTYFWVYAALIIIIGFYLQGKTALEYPEGDLPLPQALDKQPKKRQRGATRQKPVHQDEVSTMPGTQGASLVSYSLLVGFILATMGFALIGRQVNSQGQRFALLGFFVVVWFICSTMASSEAEVGITSSTDSIKRTSLLISLGWFVVFIIVHVSAMQGDTANLFMFYYVYLFSTIIVIAVVLLNTMPIAIRFQARIHWWPYPLLIIGIVILIIIANLNPIKADIYYKRGLDYANGGQWDESITLFQRALELAPGQDFYYLFLAGAYVEKARAVSDMTQRSAWLEEARRSLERGHEISPLNPDHVSKLGLLYRTWGEMLTDEQEKTEKFDKALDYYRQAEALSPHDPKIFNEWGLVHFAKGEYEQAIDKYQRSLSLNNRSIQTYLLLGDTYRASEDLPRAMEAYERIVEIAPDNFMGHRRLALLYEQMGRIEEALAEAGIARSLAPGNEAAALEELIIQLQAQRQ